MTECPHCKENIPDGVEFCIFCGEKVDSAQESVRDKKTTPAGKGGSGTVENAPVVEALKSAPSAVNEEAAPAIVGGELQPGVVVDGKYEVERILGEGGMGVVYLARDIHTGIEVVIKAIRAEYAHREDFRQRTLQEGRSLARIDHPNVVRLNAVVVEDDGLFLVMQFIEGESLAQRVARYAEAGEKMPLDEVEDLFSQVLRGVGAAHQEGVIHRDLKPPNILIRDRDSAVKVTDFGIAKPEEDAKAGRGQTKGIIGSLHYMAPEQLRGHRDLDKRVDIYGLGVLLFELLTGHVPFDGPSDYDIMRAHMTGKIPPVSGSRDDVSPALDDVIFRACAKDREQRFQTTDEFLDAFSRAIREEHISDTIEDEPVPEALISSPEPTVDSVRPTEPEDSMQDQPVRSRKWLFVAIAIVALISLAIAAQTYMMGMWEPLWDVPGLPARHQKAKSPSPHPAAAPSASKKPEGTVLDALVGSWKSDSGQRYDAVLADKQIELKLHKAGDLAKQGYMDGEAIFILSPLVGRDHTLAVRQRVRPSLKAPLRYDVKRARSTCLVVWSAVDAKPLQASFDGHRLVIDSVQLETSRRMFLKKGNVVIGCRDLKSSKATGSKSTFVRVKP